MDKKEARALLKVPLAELVSRADAVRRRFAGKSIELCNILNAKSGMCAEDCKFCAQSARYATRAPRYSLKSADEIIMAARRAKEIGAARFDIVTSGNALSKDELLVVARVAARIKDEIGIKMCASLGALNEESLALIAKSGVSRYHHNIETSPRYFPHIVTTHTFKERCETIAAAKRVGMEVCSGGIIGMGETWDDRIDMAFILKGLGVDSVPINILVPIQGTPFEAVRALSGADAIKTIALFRIILKDAIIKIAAGRESALRDFQALAFMAGANGMLIGGYLTLRGRSVEEDQQLVKEVEEAWRT